MALNERILGAAQGTERFGGKRSLTALSLVSVLLALTLFAVFSRLPAQNVGDGSEYYALQRAAVSSGKPFMTAAGWNSYAQLIVKGDVQELVPVGQLSEAFPSLRLGGTADFNHFWAYSALAATFELSSRGHLTTHDSFLALHAVLLSLTFLLCTRWHGFGGAVAFCLILFASPLLWFTTKVHTELFTVSLTTIALAAAMKSRWAWAAVALALASTQNISFVLPAAVACFHSLASSTSSLSVSIARTLAVSTSAVLALAHPFYYWSRHGIPTPQLLAGGASLEDVSPLKAMNYILDVDVGLLPNWPLGALTVLTFVGLALFHRPKFSPSFLLFISFYFLSCLIAQAATQNMNAGATVHVSRYGLWYLSLFFPMLVWIGNQLAKRQSHLLTGSAVLVTAALAVYNFNIFSPLGSQTYTEPTRLSRFVYSQFPSLIDPAHEVFFERYSGMGEVTPPRPSITVGPDCRKLLIFAGKGTDPTVMGRTFCGMSRKAIQGVVAERGGWADEGLQGEDRYLVNTIGTTHGYRATLSRGEVVSTGGAPSPAREYLVEGWSGDEPWGVWSVGPQAIIAFQVEPSSKDLRITLETSAFLSPNHPKLQVTPTINGVSHPSFALRFTDAMPASHTFQLAAASVNKEDGQVRIVLQIDDPRSPASLDLSSDDRDLGIGLTSITVN